MLPLPQCSGAWPIQGPAQPCQGWGRGFESLRPLQFFLSESMTSNGPLGRLVASPPRTPEPGKHGGSTRQRNLACYRRRPACSEPSEPAVPHAGRCAIAPRLNCERGPRSTPASYLHGSRCGPPSASPLLIPPVHGRSGDATSRRAFKSQSSASNVDLKGNFGSLSIGAVATALANRSVTGRRSL